MTFKVMFCMQIYGCLLLKSIYQELKKSCNVTVWCIVVKLVKYCSSTQISLFLLTGEAGIVNVQGCGMRWYLS